MSDPISSGDAASPQDAPSSNALPSDEFSPISRLGSEAELNKVIKRFGGRHLIFRTQLQDWQWMPKPYALVSDFCGPVWFFYGLGQIWLTHRKHQVYDGWTARVSRFGGQQVVALLDELESPISEFTHFCNEHGIEGTILLDPGIIEFHWTFGYELKQEAMKPQQATLLEHQFQHLTDQFLKAKQELRI